MTTLHGQGVFFVTRLKKNARYTVRERRRVSSNLRLSLIHLPLSDIFIVYNEERDAFQDGEADKSLTLKYTYMFDF